MEKNFNFMEFTFLENALIRGIFTHTPPHLKLAKFLSSLPRQKEITHSFENLFPPTAERGGGNYDFLYQNSVRKYKDGLALANVMALQFCKYYLSYSMVLILLLPLCNHDNLILKLHQKKIATLMKGGFL